VNEINFKAPKGATKKRKRVGRGIGSGHGVNAGRGRKGQNARSGGGVRPGFEGGQMPLFRRIARRGFSNALFKMRYTIINLDDLDVFKGDEKVTKESLMGKGLIKKSEGNVKLLGRGEISRKINVVIDKVSVKAKEKIEKAGGTVTELKTPKPIIKKKIKKNNTKGKK
jgi:large subunit ribosomal protein L15